jgi:ABC-type multidrug transport system ATPase subunit
MAVIEAVGVCKSYRGERALSDFSLSLEPGVIFSLLGPNGAGKSTFVKILLGLVRPDHGQVTMNGHSISDWRSRQGVAYLPEKFNFYSYYTVDAAARFFGQMQGLKGDILESGIERALKRIHIDELRKRRLSTLSKGQLQRLGIAGLMMADNQLLILDEPFSGLDPIGIKDLKDLLHELKSEGKTIFLNSHILSEMERLSDHIAILNKGQCLAQGRLKEVVGNDSLEDFFYKKVGR